MTQESVNGPVALLLALFLAHFLALSLESEFAHFALLDFKRDVARTTVLSK